MSLFCNRKKKEKKKTFLTVLLQKPKNDGMNIESKEKTDILSKLCVNSARVIQNQKSSALWFNLSFASLDTIQQQLLRKRKVSSLCCFGALCCPRPSKSLLTSLSLCYLQKLVSFFSSFIFSICVKLLRLPHIKLYKSHCDLNIWLMHLKSSRDSATLPKSVCPKS